ncbi:unnamed protein product [Pleuronectes platessa]|uniref:Uncharacterized protein n=1 Tax=Pleuronectes platessa TaxID=8262 RepID=A0A9N7UXK2_PLEPL|nr:unnamed protein product [Pleuronectes platessa]
MALCPSRGVLHQICPIHHERLVEISFCTTLCCEMCELFLIGEGAEAEDSRVNKPQSNKVIIRQRLADLERPGQSKAAVMWGLALAHVTVTQSGSSCCQGIEGWRDERLTTEAEFKERKQREVPQTSGTSKADFIRSPLLGVQTNETPLSSH